MFLEVMEKGQMLMVAPLNFSHVHLVLPSTVLPSLAGAGDRWRYPGCLDVVHGSPPEPQNASFGEPIPRCGGRRENPQLSGGMRLPPNRQRLQPVQRIDHAYGSQALSTSPGAAP
jgi:hypothetical protein